MRKGLVLLCVLTVASVCASADPIVGFFTPGITPTSSFANGPIVTFGGSSAGVYVENGVTYGTDTFALDTGSLAGEFRSPYEGGGDITNPYISVPKGGLSAPQSYTITFAPGVTHNYF